MYIIAACCDAEKHSSAIKQREDQKVDHNLYTWAEYNSNYPTIFTMCATISIFAIVLSVSIILMLANIDSSSFSVLYREPPSKLKSE
ncbi:hypothetical protein HZS_1143 [Henneguya salminicola]|nr:hypothetical protein HZS_1143 [Henneguya salminicola]